MAAEPQVFLFEPDRKSGAFPQTDGQSPTSGLAALLTKR